MAGDGGAENSVAHSPNGHWIYRFDYYTGNKLKTEKLVNLKNVAEMIKATPDKKYSVIGYADNATGTSERNAMLAKERSQNVYDILIREYGVSASSLLLDSKGGVDNMYLNDPQLSRSVIISEVK